MHFNNRLITFMALLCLGGTQLSYAQKKSKTGDYIVTLQNDTLRGQIKNPNGRKIRFKPIDGESFSSYTADNINAYYLNKDSMAFIPLAIKLGSKPIFLWAKERGKIDLLIDLVEVKSYPSVMPTGPSGNPTMMFGGISFGKRKINYIRKDGGKLIKLKKKRAVLTDLMADAPEIVASIQTERKFNKEIIAKYIHLYNQQQLSKP